MKIKIYTLLMSFLISSAASAAKLPQAWITDTLEDPSFDKSTEMIELEKEYDNILDAKSQLVEKIATKKQERKNRKWYLQSIKSEIEIESVGTIGIGAFASVKIATAVEFIWNRTKESMRKLQQKYYGASDVSTVDKSVEKEINGSSDQDTIRFNSATSTPDLEKEIAPFVEASFKLGKIKDKKLFKTNLIAKINDYQKVLSDLDGMPKYTPWWVYKFQFDLYFDASGKVLPFMSVGVGVGLKLEWYRIRKKNSDKSVKEMSDNSKFIMAMAQDFETLDKLTLGKKKKAHYGLQYLKVGIGIGAKGQLGVAKLKGHLIGSAFFRRAKNHPNNKIRRVKLNNTFPIIDAYNSENLAYAKENSIEVEPNVSSDKSRIGDRIKSGIFKASRANFRKGLKKAIKMANFWSRVPLRRQAKRIARGKEQHFDLKIIELELEVYLRGTVGVATLEGIGVLELFLVKQS
ncbi:MAG: hypothetical protein DRQ88_09745 [Epsilonproteobacteria bacterium]|nr:MAG: hypothetical protein DRQ89_12115 [Campylobacterota bacterium]RLA65167.1 MAG: hypothetical protein DRQ88_09745 [Campylobacterota bacterium]